MTYNFTGRIFKIPFPFTDLSAAKARPALALCEPDDYGDIEFVFITTKSTRGLSHTLDLPDGLLPFPSKVHTDKSFLLNKNIIQKELAQIDPVFLDKVLRSLTSKNVFRYYENTHFHRQNRKFVKGENIIHSAGRVFDEKEMLNLVDAGLDFWLTEGRYADSFKSGLGKFLNINHVLPVNSGSSANLAAISALTSPSLKDRRIMPGDEVITDFGFVITVRERQVFPEMI